MTQNEWQPIESAPVMEVVDWWIDGSDQDDGPRGWRKTGYRCDSCEPLAIVEEDGGVYWPNENGGWPTHWMPLPPPPDSKP